MKMYYSLTESAEILGYKNGMVLRDYIFRGKIKGTKFGRNWVIHYKELQRFEAALKAKRTKMPPKGEKAVESKSRGAEL